MSRGVRSTQLYNDTVTIHAATWTTLYTAPSGVRTIVKFITAQIDPSLGSSRRFVIAIHDAGGAGPQIIRRVPTLNETEIYNVWAVMNAGDKLETALADGGTPDTSFAFHIAGAELLL